MGIENRDYARYDGIRGGYGRSGGGGFRDWEVWKKLIVANIVIFVLQTMISRPMTLDEYQRSLNLSDEQLSQEFEGLPDGDFSNGQLPREVLRYLPQVSPVQLWLELDSDKVLKGQVWRLFTCGFCHSRTGLWHLFFNMLLLFWCGRRLESRYGPREFAAFYFAALLTSSLAYIALDIYTGDLTPAIGASGAVWGLMALYALLYPYERVYVYFLFPIQIRYLALIYFLFDLHPILLALSGDRMFSGVAHAAHVGGAIFGFLYWRNNWRVMNWISQFTPIGALNVPRRRSPTRSQRSRPASEPAGPSILPMPSVAKATEPWEAELDAVLDKIHREGRESLTESELDTLEHASRQLRRRGK